MLTELCRNSPSEEFASGQEEGPCRPTWVLGLVLPQLTQRGRGIVVLVAEHDAQPEADLAAGGSGKVGIGLEAGDGAVVAQGQCLAGSCFRLGSVRALGSVGGGDPSPAFAPITPVLPSRVAVNAAPAAPRCAVCAVHLWCLRVAGAGQCRSRVAWGWCSRLGRRSAARRGHRTRHCRWTGDDRVSTGGCARTWRSIGRDTNAPRPTAPRRRGGRAPFGGTRRSGSAPGRATNLGTSPRS